MSSRITNNVLIKTFRIDEVMAEFLKENFRDRRSQSASQFIVNLITNSNEYKKYLDTKKSKFSLIKKDVDNALKQLDSNDFSDFEPFGKSWHK